MNIREYIKHKNNKAVKINKVGDKFVATITTYNIYTGKKETKDEEIDVQRYEMERDMFENDKHRAESDLEDINSLLNDIKNK